MYSSNKLGVNGVSWSLSPLNPLGPSFERASETERWVLSLYLNQTLKQFNLFTSKQLCDEKRLCIPFRGTMPIHRYILRFL